MAREFIELYVQGNHDVVRGFVTGYRSGVGSTATLFVNSDHGVADDGIVRQIAELAHLVRTITHLVIATDLRDGFVGALEEQGAALGVKLCGEFSIARARLDFKWEVYSPDEAMDVRRLFENERPRQVQLEGYDPEEIIREETGDGMYTPLHDFIVKAAGVASGPPDVIADWGKRLRENPFIHVEAIRLEYIEDAPPRM